MKSQWEDWAREWGLTHHPPRGLSKRSEWMVGAYRGYLLKIGWVGDKAQEFFALIRYPKVADAAMVADRIAQDPAVNVLPGWKQGKTGPRLDGLQASETGLIWKRRYSWRNPKPADTRAWVEALVNSLAPLAQPFAGRCEHCGSSSGNRFVMVEQVPMYLCDSCQAQMVQAGQMAAAEYEQLDANYLLGGIYGAAAAVAGGAVWALIAVLSNRMFALLAIGIAFLVTKAYQIGAKKIDWVGQVVAVLFSLAGVMLGQVLFYAALVQRQEPTLGFRLELGWQVLMRVLTSSPGDVLFAGLCGLIGAYYAARMMKKPKFTPKIEQIEPPAA